MARKDRGHRETKRPKQDKAKKALKKALGSRAVTGTGAASQIDCRAAARGPDTGAMISTKKRALSTALLLRAAASLQSLCYLTQRVLRRYVLSQDHHGSLAQRRAQRIEC